MTTEIRNNGMLYAVLHRAEDWQPGINFVTPGESFCQVGTWQIPAGKYAAHEHVPQRRESTLTQECVIVLGGAVGVTIYDIAGHPFETVVLHSGDFIVTLAGGHGYEILEQGTRVIEAKNGPHIAADLDKRTLGLVTPVPVHTRG